MRISFRVAGLFLLGLLSGCANMPADPDAVPGQALPMDVGIGIYIPEVVLNYTEIYQNQMVQRGHFTREGVDAVARHFFRTVVYRDQPTNEPIQLMLGLDPKWSSAAGKLTLDLAYHLFAPNGTLLSSGTKSETLTWAGNSPNVMLTNLAIKASQQIMVEVVNSADTMLNNRSEVTTVNKFPAAVLVNEDRLMRTGTGFYINGSGQLLAASSTVQGCLRIDVGSGDAHRLGTVNIESQLLNLAVIDTGAPVTSALAMEVAKPALGAATTAVSYHRAKDGQINRSFSFGNVVSFEGVAGAFGVFQFSAATAPQANGAPIVGADGKLIGVYSGGYTYDSLHKEGLLPANTFQGLDGLIAEEFLKRNKIAFSTQDYADQLSPVDRATAAAVPIVCHQ
jgi:serine protease Do